MTYPIHPGPFFREHQIGESLPNTFSCSEAFELEEGHPIYGPLESILLDQGFPVEYEFNTPHTGTTLSPLQLWLC